MQIREEQEIGKQAKKLFEKPIKNLLFERAGVSKKVKKGVSGSCKNIFSLIKEREICGVIIGK